MRCLVPQVRVRFLDANLGVPVLFPRWRGLARYCTSRANPFTILTIAVLYVHY